MLLENNFYGLVIRDDKNKIIGIGKRNYKEDIFFTGLDEFPNNSFHFFSNEGFAKRSFTAKASRQTAYMSEKVAKEVERIYGYPLTVIYNDKYIISYKDFKNIIEVANLRLSIEEV